MMNCASLPSRARILHHTGAICIFFLLSVDGDRGKRILSGEYLDDTVGDASVRRLKIASSFSSDPTGHHTEPDGVHIIPQANQLTQITGTDLVFSSRRGVHVEAPSDALVAAVQRFILEGSGVSRHEDAHAYVRLKLSVGSSKSAGTEEAYTLETTENGVEITSQNEHGLFNGVMTLSQLATRGQSSSSFLQADDETTVSLPSVKISDSPAFPWRGMMLDVSRHFFPVEDIKRVLDTMALFKLNRFHWHLTDDQGWRVESDAYPLLTEKGAWREGTQIGHDVHTSDGHRYGGFYTKADVKDIIDHAHSLHIEVVPEVDMPGHVQAILAAYPDLGNTDMPDWQNPSVATQFGAQPYTLAPTTEGLNFAKGVVREVMQLVPSQYFHLGGDEVSHEQWMKSPRACSLGNSLSELSGTAASIIQTNDSSFLEANQSSNASSMGSTALGRKIQELFTGTLAKHVMESKRTPIVWDEALAMGSLPKSAAVMVWRHWGGQDPAQTAQRAAELGHKVILAPMGYTYFDQPQARGEVGRPHDSNGGSPLNLAHVYEFPTSDYGKSTGAGGSVLGGQAQLWSEYIPTVADLEYMAWPRGIALAEVFWSGSQRPGFADFQRRLKPRLSHLQRSGIRFRAP